MNTELRWKKMWLSIWLFGMGLGVYLSLKPSIELPTVLPQMDKLIHTLSYACLAVVATCIFQHKKARFRALLWVIVLGGLIELAQGYFTSTRQMEWADFFANCFGVLLGFLWARRFNVLAWLEQTIIRMAG